MKLARTLAVLLCVWLASANLFENSDVVDFNKEGYESQIKEGTWFIVYYISGCRGCHMMKDAWKETAKALKGQVRVAALDLQRFPIGVERLNGFPTIRWLVDGTIVNQYTGERTTKDLVAYATNMLQKTEQQRV